MHTKRLKTSLFVMLLLSLFLILLIVSSCSNKSVSSLNGDERKAADMLESKGYSIISTLGELEGYELSKEKLIQPPYMNIWSVQERKPEQYIGKSITSYSFVVSGHPLEYIYASADISLEYEIHIGVLLSDGIVIGGYSYPVRKDGTLLMGGFYSIDGKTQEEMTGLSYNEWLIQWKKTYSD